MPASTSHPAKTLPGLDKSPKKNWVDKAGGLPKMIDHIARHLHSQKGFTISHGIATAVNAVKKMCATGDLNFPGSQDVNAGSRANACAAVAQWEKMKSEHSVESDERMVELVASRSQSVVELRNYSEEERKKLAKKGKAMPDGSYPIVDKTDLGNAIQAYGRTDTPEKTKNFIIKRAKELDAVSMLPESWNVSESSRGALEDAKVELSKDLDAFLAYRDRYPRSIQRFIRGVLLARGQELGVLDLAGKGQFDPSKHLRSPITGKFITKVSPAEIRALKREAEGIVSKLRLGQSHKLPAKLGWVKQTGKTSWLVQGPNDRKAFRTRSETVQYIASIIAVAKETKGESG